MNQQLEVKATANAKPMAAVDVKANVDLIQQVMQTVMKRGSHYDVIPGTQEPTLLKPGAEKILTAFRIAAMPEVFDLSNEDEIRYRVICQGVHQPTGIVVGAGVGECSSNEEKYKWRGIVCDEEWEATPENQRRTKFGKARGGGHYSAKQVRTNPADLANTVLKMAKKRAMVDMTLTATAASDIFKQDLEDMPPEYRQQHEGGRQIDPPKVASGNSGKDATEPQVRMVKVKLEQAGKTEADLCKAFEIGNVEELKMGQVNDALAWIQQ